LPSFTPDFSAFGTVQSPADEWPNSGTQKTAERTNDEGER
jgi:hypothetical protein